MNKQLVWTGVLVLGLLVSGTAMGQEAPQWAFGVRAAAWSIPGTLLDQFLDEHPSVKGETYGMEFRYYGADGPSGVFSVSYGFDVGRIDGTGFWLLKDDDPDEDGRRGKAQADVYALTATFLWDIMPEWVVHPYLGLGIGVAYVDGEIPPGEEDDDDSYKGPAPAVNIPLGLRAQLTENLSLNVDARLFMGGLALGGGVAYAW